MPNAELFTELINLVEVDPFALLGISVSADEKRIAKRYRHVAKQLHPDALSNAETNEGITPALAAQIIARIVNPAYQKLKHEKGRQETLTLLRLQVRQLIRAEKLIPTFKDAQKLEIIAEDSVEVFYEQAMSQLAAAQFRSMGDLHTYSLEIGQLNLVYLRRKMTDLIIRSKRAGLITSAVTPTGVTTGRVSTATVLPSEQDASSDPNSRMRNTKSAAEPSYAAKHTARAKTYLSQQNYEMAVQELRDAIKLSPRSPEIHSMLGQTYYKQKMLGMAKAHFRQALKLKPNHKVAQKYGRLLSLSDKPQAQNTLSDQSTADSVSGSDKANEKPKSKRAWFSNLLNR